LGLKVHALDDVNAASALQCLASLKPDLLVTFAFNQKLGHDLLQIAPHGAINVHPSLLPKYRGAAPVARAILNGQTKTGISIIRMVQDLDAGPIFAQEPHDIGPQHTTAILEEYLGQQAAPLLARVIDQIEKGSAKPIAQDHSQASLAPKIKKDEARLDFSLPATELVNHIRAFTPWPGAFAFFHCQARPKPERVVINQALAEQTDLLSDSTSGTVLKDLCIQCGQGVLRIERIKPSGSKDMNWQDFVNGRNIQPGDKFTDYAH
jgi:methionyl-tRNA formyltransferase